MAGGANATKNAALEIVREESVEKRIEAAVDIGEAREWYLDKNEPGRDGCRAVLNDEGQMQRQPADCEYSDDYNDHASDSSLGQR